MSRTPNTPPPRVAPSLTTLLLIAALAAVPRPATAETAVNGTLRDGGDHQVLHVWGTHYEMGYAHGYLLAERVKALAEGYILPMFGLSAAEYEDVQWLMLTILEIPAPIQEEAQGVIDGVEAAGVPLYVEALDRDLTPDDLLLANAAADLFGVEFGCSSVSAWGAATAGDPELEGELAMARDLDWDYGGGAADIRDFGLVIAYHPTGEGEQRWVSVAMPGYIFCLSCFSEAGVGAFQNQGNHGTHLFDIDQDPIPRPINLSMRLAIESADRDGDGRQTIDDVVHEVSSVGRIGTYEIHLISPAERSDPPAAILEANNGGWALRLPDDDPLPAPDCVATTNHHRELYPPVGCDRYDTIVQMVDDAGGAMTLDRLWDIEKAASWSNWGSGTVQTMRVVPATRRLDVAFADHADAAPYRTPTSYEFEWLFADGGPPAPPEDGDDDGATGCACGMAPGGAARAAALLGVLALLSAAACTRWGSASRPCTRGTAPPRR